MVTSKCHSSPTSAWTGRSAGAPAPPTSITDTPLPPNPEGQRTPAFQGGPRTEQCTKITESEQEEPSGGKQGCTPCSQRRFSLQLFPERKIPSRYLGQPSPFTHPHLLRPGEVTPGLSQVEYALRRHKLMSLIQKEARDQSGTDQAVVLLSNPTFYMSNDIPYVFHQDNNFLYLCGFQEPDSILVLQSLPGKELPTHKAMLFVPRRDPSRELWDGPRSGADGAVALTGVDEAFPLEEFKHLVPKLKAETSTVWYDWSKPSHAQLHLDFMKPVTEAKAGSRNRVRAVRQLIQRLRLIKSPSEIALLQAAGRLTSQDGLFPELGVFFPISDCAKPASSLFKAPFRLCPHEAASFLDASFAGALQRSVSISPLVSCPATAAVTEVWGRNSVSLVSPSPSILPETWWLLVKY
ncbi:xaa-Pro aminopeptidase 3 isoform X4 [Antechinus flavipes]|uniref:xaa-Pro aminopeptidase 3 isoform X4 n=1 Tax=Antechinus flavipes TaxID=38775 RepID=UPI002236A056|nr:xaa-Pro aminopeptidase 3 isoform X4 [Antechinus flavipes]